MRLSISPLPIIGLGVSLCAAVVMAEPWQRHTIDSSSRGADGVRLADVNDDGWMDITTGWEQGGVVRLYVNPGPAKVKQNWPAVTVGQVTSAEDAVFVDLDGDGATDVVSSCEGRTRTMYVHWAPAEPRRYLEPTAWRTEPIPVTQRQHRWMFALPLQLDGKGASDLVASSKSGALGWLQAPDNPRELSAWTYHPLYRAGWIMSLVPVDMDGDGDTDVLVSDRKGSAPGILWLENPGAKAATGSWNEHRLGLNTSGVMFIDTADVNGDNRLDVVAAVQPRKVVFLLQPGEASSPWASHEISFPDRFGTSKAVRAADVDLDGKLDLVVTCENAKGPLSGVFWLSYRDEVMDDEWNVHDIGGPKGVKYDLIELLDLDDDGDLDLITCEERDNLGVIWYENPASK